MTTQSDEGSTVDLAETATFDSTPLTNLPAIGDNTDLTLPTFTLSPNLAASILLPSDTTSVASNATTTTDPSTSTASTSTTSTSSSSKYSPIFPVIDDDDDERKNPASAAAGFECHICLDIAKDAVVSLCGHLFCWPCLHQWLDTRPAVQLCPVCKAGISKDKVVPLYGRGGNGEQKDPRTKPPPPRPQGQRSEPESQGGLGGGTFGGWPGMIFGDGGSHLSFGIGAFPFAFFASAFNLNDGRPPPPEVGTQQYREETFLNRVFVVVSVLFAIWLVLL